MRRILTFLSIVISFLFYKPTQLQSQVITRIGDFQMCYKASTSMPVTVQNMIGVDSLRLVLGFDNQSIEYVEYFALHQELTGGSFEIISENDSIILNWYGNTPATIFNDTLVWVKFVGMSGNTDLKWKVGSSFYHTSGGFSIAEFENGSSTVNPQINVLLTEIDQTCSSVCNANFMANASGGMPPYAYRWNGSPGRFDSIQTNMCSGPNLLSVKDSWGCTLDSNFTINGLPGANVKLIIEGNEDTAIYLENPTLTFRFEEVFPTHIVEPPLWDFGDGDTARAFNPTHVFERAITNSSEYYDLKLYIRNENGCDSTIEIRLFVKDADLKIPGVITPNDDGINDTFMILNEKKTGSGEEIKITTEFQRMELAIFDRWGRKIYDDSNYQSDWKARGVPDGTYYYILKTVGFYRTEVKKGALTILGGGMSQ